MLQTTAAALLLGAISSTSSPVAAQAEAVALDGFEFAYPAAELEGLPGLNQRIASLADSAQTDFASLVAETRTAMPGNPAVDNLAHSENWVLAGRTGQLVSLGGTIYEYAGGAHGNTDYSSLLWDAAEDRAVTVTQLFSDRYAGLAAIDGAYCEGLQAMQVERGLQPGEWGDCPLLHEMTIVPTGDAGGPFTVFQVLVPPYAAGPYAVGSFEVEVPVTDAMVALVRPEYRDSFATGG